MKNLEMYGYYNIYNDKSIPEFIEEKNFVKYNLNLKINGFLYLNEKGEECFAFFDIKDKEITNESYKRQRM